MDIRYQVFVSSTFRDLQTERQAVLDAVLGLGHIPAGMEVFPAASATPWTLIRKIIAESDYYLLIIGGRYGSTDEHGISYTEREYDLAQELKIPTLVFLPADPKAIPSGKTEVESKARKKLAKFRSKVEKHHCKFWQSAEDLQAKVVLGLNHEIMANPRIGWMRATITDSAETLTRLNLLLEQNHALNEELKQFKEARSRVPTGEDLFARGEEEVFLRMKLDGRLIKHKMTWKAIFRSLAPLMLTKQDEASLILYLLALVGGDKTSRTFDKWYAFISSQHAYNGIEQSDWESIVMQFLALGYWEPVECFRTKTNVAARNVASSEIPVPGYKLTTLGVQRLAESKAQLKL